MASIRNIVWPLAVLLLPQDGAGYYIPSRHSRSAIPPAITSRGIQESTSSAQLFPFEKRQLTDEVINSLRDLGVSHRSLFDFQREDSSTLVKRQSECKTYPGDESWPSDEAWAEFDSLLGGTLIPTIPAASSCYSEFGNFDEGRCANVTENWTDALVQVEDPTSIYAYLFQGLTCIPPTIRPSSGGQCTLGGSPAYAVAVTTVAEVQLAVNFARNAGLRLVIKNTGHDFSGKSTGGGALSIWTHGLQDIEFIPEYQSDDEEASWNGPAMKVGTGLLAHQLYEASKQYGVSVVGGEGYSVGVVGGYVLGGGHSPLTSIHGFAADQVLAMEIVTADGRFVTASASSNPDLFWAQRGGGGSTFGVVTSIVIKAHPQITTSTINWNMTTLDTRSTSGNSTISADQLWGAMEAFYARVPEFVTENGNYMYYWIDSAGNNPVTGEQNFISYMGAWVAPNMTQAQVEAMTAPLWDEWEALGVSLRPEIRTWDNFYDAWRASFPPEFFGLGNGRIGSWLLPKAALTSRENANATNAAIRSIVSDGGWFVGVEMDPTGPLVPPTPYRDNAVNPAWQDSSMLGIVINRWPEDGSDEVQAEISNRLTDDFIPRLQALGREEGDPLGGTYVSESDYMQPDFQQAFWGEKYARLYEIKQQLDPTGVFYAHHTVGSEDWEVRGRLVAGGTVTSQDGRLCRI